MCLILFAYQAREDYPLVVAANRDEFYERPTAPAAFWQDQSGLLAGRDLRAGGTWLGITVRGRFAAVTNFRDPAVQIPEAPSRGALVVSFLRGDESPAAFLERLAAKADRYNGFNLLVGDRRELWYFSNRDARPRPLAPGVYGLSNHLIDTQWPKVQRGKTGLQAALTAPVPDVEALLDLLSDETLAPDDLLPDTGVGPEWERALSALFIRTPVYGTRSSTVLLVDRAGTVTFVERSYAPDGAPPETKRFQFTLEPDSASNV